MSLFKAVACVLFTNLSITAMAANAADCTAQAEAVAKDAISELAMDDTDLMIAHPTERTDVYTVYLGARARYRTIEVSFGDEVDCADPSARVYD